MIGRVILAIVVGVVAALVCLLVGIILVATDAKVLTDIGQFLKDYNVVAGVLVGLYYFFVRNKTEV